MSKSEILERYIRRAQAAGTVVECVVQGELPGRLAAVLGELAHAKPPKIAALSASGWPEGLGESVEAVLASLGFEVTMPGKGQGGYAWDRDRLPRRRSGLSGASDILPTREASSSPRGRARGGLATLLPQISVVLSDAEGCLEGLSDYLRRRAPRRPAHTLATGPSRTGDIEATMTKGVHGPGKVVRFYHWWECVRFQFEQPLNPKKVVAADKRLYSGYSMRGRGRLPGPVSGSAVDPDFLDVPLFLAELLLWAKGGNREAH